MKSNEIVKLLDSKIIRYPNPAVYISGGLDSTILLHHLKSKMNGEGVIYTYTFGWSYYNEFKHARKVAEHYETIHREILLDGWLNRFSGFLKLLQWPRFNLQPFFLAEQAAIDGCKTAYCAEGLDESFGGYWYKDIGFLQSFADHFIYIQPIWQQAHEFYSLKLEMPFSDLPIEKTLPFWDSNGNKQCLREVYHDILPGFVVERKKNSSSPHWGKLWTHELHKFIPGVPTTDEEVRHLFNVWVTSLWVEHKLERKLTYESRAYL